MLARLAHPNVARLIDAGVSAAAQPYLVLEFVEGERIDHYCDGRQLDVAARLKLFLDVLAAVAHAHANLIVHRDIKPSNVLVASDGTVKLLDFGIAKLLEGETHPGEATELTREAGRALTPEYAAPEQVLGAAVTTATDVYALGVLLYVLLGGQHPVGTNTRSAAELIKAIVDTSAPRLSDAVTSTRTLSPEALTDNAARRAATPEKLKHVLRGDLDNIVAKALKKNPLERYGSVTAFADDINRYLKHEPVSARPDSFGYRAVKFVRRNQVSVTAATIAALTLVVATVVTTWQMVDARRQRDEARYQAQRAEASSEVMSLMLEEVGPGGKPLTLDALIDRGVVLIERRYSSDPHLTGLMMVQMARRYMDLDRLEQEKATLVRALAIAQRTDDAEVIASAQCALVHTERKAGRLEEAARAFAEGSRALARLGAPSVQSRVDCLRAAAELGNFQGRWGDASRQLNEAKELLERAGDTHTLWYTSVLNDLGEVLFRSGHWRESLTVNQMLLDAFERNGRGRTLGNATLMVNRASVLYNLGEIKASETAARSARERVEALSDLDVAPFAWAQGRALVRLGKNAEAIELLRSAAARLEANDASMTASRIHSDLAQALANDRQFAAAEHELSLAEAVWVRDPATNAGSLLQASLLRSEIALAQDQKEKAQQLVDHARSELAKPTANTPFYRFRVNRTAARIALARGDAAGADAVAAEALRIAEDVARDPAFSADVGEALLLRAQARIAQGDTSAARPLLERAATSLAGGLGSEHALTQQASYLLASTRG
jgi:eukaryotic-like serine/threonine-protein kinase